MLNSLFILATFLLVIFSFGLGVFSLWKNPKSKVVRLWFLVSMAVGLWGGGFLLMLLSNTEEEVILYAKLLHVGAAFIPIFFCHFILSFLYQTQKKKFFLGIGYFLATIIAVLSVTSSFIVSGTAPGAGFNLWLKAGSLYSLFVVYFSFYALSSVYFLIKGYQQNDGIRKKQIFYVLLAAIVGFGGGMSNFLPQTVGIYPFSHFVTWLYPILITYGIFIEEIKFKIKF